MRIVIAFVVFVGFILVVSLGIGSWYMARKWNYNLSYKSMVKQTIIDMVKEDCLIKEGK